MNKNIIFIIFIIIITFILIAALGRKDNKLAIPGFTQQTKVTDTPKTFDFDSSTDLKMELETVNPQVLDSDFNE